MTRLGLTYDPPTPGAPATMILKMSRPGFANRSSIIGGGQYREAKFYESMLAASLPAGLMPRCYYAHGSGMLGQYVMLLEDCAGVTPVNFVFGNQIWGIPKAVDPPRDPVSVLRAMFTAAAEFHSHFWCSQRLLRMSWLKGARWFNNDGRQQWELALSKGKQAWEYAKAKYTAEPAGDVVLSPKLIKIIDESFARSSWAELQEHLHNPDIPFTLCHGDFHASNMFLRNAGDRERDVNGCVETLPSDIVMFDWSEVGPWEGTVDLAQTIISDVRPEVFKVHSKPAVRAYWEHLTRPGSPVDSTVYTFDKCWESFCRGGAERWIWVFCVIASFPGIPGGAVQYFHNQLLAFIESHNPQPYYILKSVVCMA